MKTNVHIVDLLDVTFNLLDGIYKQYKKPNDQLLYVNNSSNHPPQIIKQLYIWNIILCVNPLLADALLYKSLDFQIYCLEDF